jgi:hypothetical protein
VPITCISHAAKSTEGDVLQRYDLHIVEINLTDILDHETVMRFSATLLTRFIHLSKQLYQVESHTCIEVALRATFFPLENLADLHIVWPLQKRRANAVDAALDHVEFRLRDLS